MKRNHKTGSAEHSQNRKSIFIYRCHLPMVPSCLQLLALGFHGSSCRLALRFSSPRFPFASWTVAEGDGGWERANETASPPPLHHKVAGTPFWPRNGATPQHSDQYNKKRTILPSLECRFFRDCFFRGATAGAHRGRGGCMDIATYHTLIPPSQSLLLQVQELHTWALPHIQLGPVSYKAQCMLCMLHTTHCTSHKPWNIARRATAPTDLLELESPSCWNHSCFTTLFQVHGGPPL